MHRAIKKLEARKEKRKAINAITRANKEKNNAAKFDITSETVDALPDTIRMCIKERIKLLVYSSQEDIPGKQNIVELYRKACTEYGLLGFFNNNKDLYTENEWKSVCKGIITAAYGKMELKQSSCDCGDDHHHHEYDIDMELANAAEELSNEVYDILYVSVDSQ